jgi:hypothetical protein
MATPLLTKYMNPVTFSAAGEARLMPLPVDVSSYSKVNLEITGSSPAGHTVQVLVEMGVIGGTTVASVVLQFPLSTTGTIHTVNVVGPEMTIVLTGGVANASLAIQAWTFLQ